MRIMIVDEEIHVAQMLAESVRNQGHEAVVASSHEEGLSRVAKTSFDGVFLEVIPKPTGIEFLRRIRETHPTLPVIVITSDPLSEELDEARRLGVTDIIGKPVALRNLNQALANLRSRGG